MKHYLTANASFGDYRADSDSLHETLGNATRGYCKRHTRSLAAAHKHTTHEAAAALKKYKRKQDTCRFASERSLSPNPSPVGEGSSLRPDKGFVSSSRQFPSPTGEGLGERPGEAVGEVT